jgi:hypothetical protein
VADTFVDNSNNIGKFTSNYVSSPEVDQVRPGHFPLICPNASGKVFDFILM